MNCSGMKGKCKMIKILEDITELELVVTDMTHEEVLTKYWSEQAFSSMLGDDEDIENSLMYAVYNDKIDDYFQLGTLTEILNEDNECIAIKVYREVISQVHNPV